MLKWPMRETARYDDFSSHCKTSMYLLRTQMMKYFIKDC